MKTIIPLSLALLFFNCKNESTELSSNREIETAIENIKIEDSTYNATIPSSNHSENDENIFEEFPIKFNENINLFLPGKAEKYELSETLFKEDERFIGLYKNKEDNSFYIKNTSISTNELESTEEDSQYFEVITEKNNNECIYLINGLHNLPDTTLSAVSKFNNQILPNEFLEFTFLNQKYKISAIGNMDNPNEISHYQLFIENLAEKNSKTLLSSILFFDDKMLEILFIGDLDFDGKLDLIIDNSSKYTHSKPTLYLSSFATGTDLVKPICSTYSYGGC